ncbi:UNVERIFIED_CONTAM: hypothetical protein PYX00_008810 [Menopon gallinae]|uniref:non-specific serine/threonine protein kinase n=1 Tax=Menopon gallinae TaxID=328185 RepID=A0AAW2HPK7_9NEOP
MVDESAPEDILTGYERLRIVGKGAFGVAVLYRKVCDDTLVVIKEINMIELTASERQLAFNEVQMLRILSHPNIISYYRSFEKDGMLLIEMEYADGGTLARFLSQQLQPIKEIDIILMFKQIVSAIKYMHDFNILHRDLKTANVFLTKERIVKVGDFGISKMITTLAQAHSVLGTPYYISPEMCEGKEYDQKSDIWALGCILYEMACLQKTFDGTNLPVLVNKIMRGQFEPVSTGYSTNFRHLINELLQKDPMLRPSAAEILDSRLKKIMSDMSKSGYSCLEEESSHALQRSCNRSGKAHRSVLYEFTSFGSTVSLIPVPLPPKFKIKEIAVSNTHFLALTTELIVYSWGEGGKGQLGHGDIVPRKGTPQPIELLIDKNIKTIAAGDGFSVFASASGMLMSCGEGSFGCLGHGDWTNAHRPKLIEKLLSVDITTISCGAQHILALSAEGIMYAWGRGQDGQLGLGHQENCSSPEIVPVPDQMILRNIRCGRDATMVITSNGSLLACGKNSYNKLGLSRRAFFSSVSQDIENSLGFKKVMGIKDRVLDVSLGPYHTTLLTEQGQVLTMGRNSEGQLGRKNTKAPRLVDSLAGKIITMIKSGPTFTITATLENEIYFWGTRYKEFSTQAILSSGTWISHECQTSSALATMLRTSVLDDKPSELIAKPKEILGLYASKQQIRKGETVGLAGMYVFHNSIFILVDTTAPLNKKLNQKMEE